MMKKNKKIISTTDKVVEIFEVFAAFGGVYMGALASALKKGASLEEAHTAAIAAVDEYEAEEREFFGRAGTIGCACGKIQDGALIYTSHSGKKYIFKQLSTGKWKVFYPEDSVLSEEFRKIL